MLSGGEKARLAMAKFMLTQGTLLVLDEPTNHLDIPSKEMLEEALLAFEGSVIAVTHDRYFLRRTMTRIVTVGLLGLGLRVQGAGSSRRVGGCGSGCMPGLVEAGQRGWWGLELRCWTGGAQARCLASAGLAFGANLPWLLGVDS